MKIIRNNKKKGDCGVVAAYNAASWCNISKPYEEVEKIARSCGYNPERGIYFFQFSNLVKKLGLPAKKIRPKNLDEILDKLYRGKFFVFLYTPVGYHTGHAISAFVDHKGRITLVNPEPGKNPRATWSSFVVDMLENGAKNFAAYEIPRRSLVKRHDESRAS